jgi:hypothetical protein
VCVTPDKNHSLSLSLRALTAETSGIPGISGKPSSSHFPPPIVFPSPPGCLKKQNDSLQAQRKLAKSTECLPTFSRAPQGVAARPRTYIEQPICNRPFQKTLPASWRAVVLCVLRRNCAACKMIFLLAFAIMGTVQRKLTSNLES